MELLQRLAPEQMDAVYIAVGGGGLISGVQRKAMHVVIHAVLWQRLEGHHAWVASVAFQHTGMLRWLAAAGCASVLKSFTPRASVIGCQPEASNVMQQSVAAGAVVDAESLDTLSDGTAGGHEHSMHGLRCPLRLQRSTWH